MFRTPKIPALFKKGMLKLVPSTRGLKRVAEATCVIDPFPVTLARELGDAGRHLVDDTGEIHDDFEAIDLRVAVGLLSVEVHDPNSKGEVRPIAILSPASIKDVSVKRLEDDTRAWLQLTFVVVFDLEERAARDFVLDFFGASLRWTFRAMQGKLLSEAAMHVAAAKLGELGPGTLVAPDGTTTTFDGETAKAHRRKAADLLRQAEPTGRKKKPH